MDHRDEWFSPESVEEQIERHLYAPDQLSANARLLHDLQHLAQDDVGHHLIGVELDASSYDAVFADGAKLLDLGFSKDK